MRKVRAYLGKTAIGSVEVDNQVDEVRILLPDGHQFVISLWTRNGDAVLIKPLRNSRLLLTPGPIDNSMILTAAKNQKKGNKHD